MKFKICTCITSRLAYWCTLLTIAIQGMMLEILILFFFKSFIIMSLMTQAMIPYLCNMQFMLPWEFLQMQGCFSINMLCGMMVVQSSSKMPELDTLFLDT